MTNCSICNCPVNSRPFVKCNDLNHWRIYAEALEDKIELKDESRDKLDVAEWLSTYPKVKEYNCHGCGRNYKLPIHINHFECICGHRCRLRHLGGCNPDEAVIDAAIEYFGNERSAQLAWIAEVVAGEHCLNYSADEIRKMIRQELDRWEMTDTGWRRKNTGR